jgi:cysteine-rich repeat protein
LTGTELIHPLFTPTTCIVGISLAITGSRCPSGTIEPGEGCDAGNTNDGDGCDNTCAVEPCWSCSGTPSVCAPLPAGTSCGDADGIDCTVDGTCDAAQHCVETPDSSLCDDENACTLEECNPIVGGCVFHDNPCDDGNPCTSDSCLGDCMHAPFIILDCKAAMSSTLVIKGRQRQTYVEIHYGDSTTQAEFADPTTNATYLFCVFAGTANASVASANLPPDATHWEATSKGFSYRDSAAAVDGISRVKLLASDADATKIILKGKGAALNVATPPYDFPITAQLLNHQSSVCWKATYNPSDVRTNDAGKLKLKATGP